MQKAGFKNRVCSMKLKFMDMSKQSAERLPAFVIVFLFAYFIYLIFTNSGLYPSVFADEYTYSKASRLAPLSESPIPGYLYLWIFSTTNSCGDGFYFCAKVLNAAFFLAATLPIYSIARKITSTINSSLISTAAVAGPINSYTAYFMPESLYFLGFWLLAWCLLNAGGSVRCLGWLGCGLLYGVVSLIKPHALLFSVALLGYIGYCGFCVQRKGLLYFVKAAAIFFAATFAAKFAAGYFSAGVAGLTLFGPAYSTVADSSVSDFARYSTLLSLSIKSLFGHSMAMAVLYGLPFAFLLVVILSSLRDEQFDPILLRLSVFSLLVIANLVVVTALFTASVANSGPYETPFRLHMRYYNFALPLLFCIAAAAVNGRFDGRIEKISLIFILILVCLAGYAAYTNIEPFSPSYVDSPELWGGHANKSVFIFFSFLSIALLLMALKSFKWAGVIYCFLFLPSLVVISNFYVDREQNRRLVSVPYDEAGIFAKGFLSREQIGRVLVVGSELPGLFRTLFHLDHPDARFELVPVKAEVDPKLLAQKRDWLLVVGDHDVVGNFGYRAHLNGFSIYRPESEILIDFRFPLNSSIVRRSYGFGRPLPQGAKFLGRESWIDFSDPLPGSFTLSMKFGPLPVGAAADYELSIGSAVVPFRIEGGIGEDIELRISSVVNPKVLKIRRKPLSQSDSARAFTHEVPVDILKLAIVPDRL